MVSNQSNVMTELAQIVQTSSETTNQSLEQLTQTIGQAFNHLTQSIGQSNSVAQPSPSPLPQEFGAVSGPTIGGPLFCVGGSCTYTAVIPSCSASTTLFTMRNPFSATSTAELLYFQGLANATTTSLQVGTTTTGVGSSLAGGSLVNGASVASSTSFLVASGLTSTLSGVQISSGSNSVTKIVVAPTQYVTGYATTTATGAGANAFTPGYTSCQGIVIWRSLNSNSN